ncbi:hypothetical protein [Azospirillum brasilense]|uniref:hypothetical protein n=1 Tax=Azospirillum brasilense TaxID=192 RepID=UPI000E0C2565|nr:hypothetical protein [Azospirillum brasilense]
MTGLAETPARSFLLEELERHHDKALPRSAVWTALLEGAERHTALARAVALRLHERLAAEARQGSAQRRRALPADRAGGDAWLLRLTGALTHHRNAASALIRAGG